jgi:Cu(I)/Ag(I) efflux system protein CusF
MRPIALFCSLLLALFGFSAMAAEERAESAGAQQAVPAAEPLSEAEVRRVDKATGRLTLRHGPLPNLEMPPMTMVFRVKDPAMLDQLKVGDKVHFRAEKLQGALVITELTQP